MNNTKILTASLDQIPNLTIHNNITANETAVSQRIDNGRSQLTAHLITQPQSAQQIDHANLLILTQNIESSFNDRELRDLCFQLNVDYENVEGQTKRDKVRELVLIMQRYNTLASLITTAAQLRPRIAWQTTAQTQGKTPIVSKLDIAVVIDVARPAAGNVAQYLDTCGIDANFLLFRHQIPGAFFSVDDNWPQLIVTFSDALDRVKREFTGSHIHFFMAGPGALLFSMGCVWGTVDEATVYHYDGKTYHPVLKTTRELRQVTTGWS